MATALPLVRDAFAVLSRDPDMEADEERHRAFVGDHVRRFVEPDLENKPAPDGELVGELRAYVEPFRDEGSVDHAELSHYISEGIFEGKSSLMRGFEEDISRFDEVVPEPRNT